MTLLQTIFLHELRGSALTSCVCIAIWPDANAVSTACLLSQILRLCTGFFRFLWEGIKSRGHCEGGLFLITFNGSNILCSFESLSGVLFPGIGRGTETQFFRHYRAKFVTSSHGVNSVVCALSRTVRLRSDCHLCRHDWAGRTLSSCQQTVSYSLPPPSNSLCPRDILGCGMLNDVCRGRKG